MSEPKEIEALRAMNRSVMPPRDADERIRSLITASIDERTNMLIAGEQPEEAMAEEAPGPLARSRDISVIGSQTDSTSSGGRWTSAAVLRAAAAVLVAVGLVFAATTIGDDLPAQVVAADTEPAALTSGEVICTGIYKQLAEQWQQILVATAPGFAVDLPRDRLELLLESQHGFLDSLTEEIESGRMMPLSEPDTLLDAQAAVNETQAVFEMRGSTDSIASVGQSHRLLVQLVEENPQLNEFCDATDIAWPQ